MAVIPAIAVLRGFVAAAEVIAVVLFVGGFAIGGSSLDGWPPGGAPVIWIDVGASGFAKPGSAAKR